MGQYFENVDLPSKMVRHDAFVLGKKFVFYTDNGVFSKDGLDFGSRLLLESIPLEEVGAKVLDMGCGYGLIGITTAKILESYVTMCDVNKRALHLANRNMEKNKIRGETILSDTYEKITKKYDRILTNPPIRAGKSVVSKILLEAKNHLKENGSLWFVIRKDQGAKSMMALLSKIAKCEIKEKSKGFYVMKAEFS